jgi:glycosyltransferase involved in cell wall biosynthesis
VAQTLAALNLLGDLAGRGAEASTAGRRLSAYWDAKGSHAPRPASEHRPIFGLRARELGFGYGTAPSIFEEVSLELPKGKLVALTAATGAGKTTLCLLLAGLLEPRKGRIEITGNPGQTPTTIADGRILYVGPNISEGLAKRIVATGVSDKNVNVVRNSVDLSRYPPLGPSDARFSPGSPLHVGYATTFEAIENLDEAVGAIACLREHRPEVEIQLTLVGTGRDWDRIAARSSKPSISRTESSFPA